MNNVEAIIVLFSALYYNLCRGELRWIIREF